MPSPSELIGLDLGQKRTGMARASTAAALAEPIKTVPTAEIIPVLQQVIKDQTVSAIVVGLPRNLQDSDTAQTTWVRQWVDDAKKQISLPFYWQDEALTSKAVESLKTKVKSPSDEHSVAAAFILQDFLNSTEAERLLA